MCHDCPMMTLDRSLADLRAEALSLLLAYKEADADTRTPLLRQLAEVIVDSRAHFLNDAGETDWKGFTYAYRTWLHGLYDDAAFDRDERGTVQASVRYHVGAVLRDRLPEETLSELGMMKQSPKERSKDRRVNRMALLNALSNREVPHGEMLALSAVYTMLMSITGQDFNDLPERDREVVATSLANMERRVASLRRKIDAVE